MSDTVTVTVPYHRYWRCGVYASGYHNGCECGPSDPHWGWSCGYRWRAPVLTDEEIRRCVPVPSATEALQEVFR